MQIQRFLWWHDNLVIARLQPHGSLVQSQWIVSSWCILHKLLCRSWSSVYRHIICLDDSRKNHINGWHFLLNVLNESCRCSSSSCHWIVGSTNNLLWWLLCVIAAGHWSDKSLNRTIECIVLGDTKQSNVYVQSFWCADRALWETEEEKKTPTATERQSTFWGEKFISTETFLFCLVIENEIKIGI